jgi:hypothetical protein
MPEFLRYQMSDDKHFLVELTPAASIDSQAVTLPGKVSGIQGKVSGIQNLAANVVNSAVSALQDALREVVAVHASALHDAIETIPNPPSEASVEFGIKLSGEAGNVIVSKVAAEANYTVKLSWKINS